MSKEQWGHGYHTGYKAALESCKPGEKFESLLEIISRHDNEAAEKIASVTDFAIAAKYWLQDNTDSFTATDILKLTEMILGKDA